MNQRKHCPPIFVADPPEEIAGYSEGDILQPSLEHLVLQDEHPTGKTNYLQQLGWQNSHAGYQHRLSSSRPNAVT
jgi:hypothetical protein